MAGIQPISGVSAPIQGITGPTAGQQGKSADKTGFSDVLRNYVDKVDQDQQASASAIQDLVSGKTDDVLPVVQAVAKADLSFKLLIGVRNKMIEAYKQTMNMQV